MFIYLQKNTFNSRYYAYNDSRRSVTIHKIIGENQFVKVSELPHLSLGICHVMSWTRTIVTNDEYFSVGLELPLEEMMALKIYITDPGTEINGTGFVSDFLCTLH